MKHKLWLLFCVCVLCTLSSIELLLLKEHFEIETIVGEWISALYILKGV